MLPLLLHLACLSFHPYRAQYIINLVSYLICASFWEVPKPLCAIVRQNPWPIAHADYRAHSCSPVPIGLLQLHLLCLWVSFRSRYFGWGATIQCQDHWSVCFHRFLLFWLRADHRRFFSIIYLLVRQIGLVALPAYTARWSPPKIDILLGLCWST